MYITFTFEINLWNKQIVSFSESDDKKPDIVDATKKGIYKYICIDNVSNQTVKYICIDNVSDQTVKYICIDNVSDQTVSMFV
jgi:hypothetical protein